MTVTQVVVEAFEADGLLLIDKPVGFTSHDVVAKLRKILRTRRIGHTGTLDPFATGLLVVCINRATRLVQFLTAVEKEYLATIRFGFRTDTADLTGVRIEEDEGRQVETLGKEELEAAIGRMLGPQLQTPPMYSAKKVAGKKLYELARKGEEIERKAVEIEIKEFELLSFEAGQEAVAKVRLVCSSGTYVRVIAEDLGRMLGVGAHLTELRRTRVGKFLIEGAIGLEEVGKRREEGALQLESIRNSLEMPEFEISGSECAGVFNGKAIRCKGEWRESALIKLVREPEVIAIAEYDRVNEMLQPRIVFHQSLTKHE